MLLLRALLFLALIHVGPVQGLLFSVSNWINNVVSLFHHAGNRWEISVDNKADVAVPVYFEMKDDTICWGGVDSKEKNFVKAGGNRYFHPVTSEKIDCQGHNQVGKFAIHQGRLECKFIITVFKGHDRTRCKFEIDDGDSTNRIRCHAVLQRKTTREDPNVDCSKFASSAEDFNFCKSMAGKSNERTIYGEVDCKEHKAFLRVMESQESRDRRTSRNSKNLNVKRYEVNRDGYESGYFLETAFTKNINEIKKEFRAKSYILDTRAGIFFGKSHDCSAKVPLYYKFYVKGHKYIGEYSRTEYAKDTKAFTGIIGYCVPSKYEARKCCRRNQDKAIHGVYYSTKYPYLHFLNDYEFKYNVVVAEATPKCYVWSEDHC